ncbi:MAG TPA: hypothetical protein P5084_13755 [Paludibacter sp.]|nr:hypothetical protein [Paludibacter sp.]
MKLNFSKPDFKYLGQVILTWTFLNITLNLFGLWFNKLISKANFEYLTNIFSEFAVPILIQTLIFSICIIFGYSLLKNKKYANFLFVAFQFLVFNIIFLLNLKFTRIIHFETTWDNWGLLYLSYNGQYLIDIINLFAPLKGKFDGNIFRPENSDIFYLTWVVLTSVYFFIVTLLTFPVLKFMRKE